MGCNMSNICCCLEVKEVNYYRYLAIAIDEQCNWKEYS